jgi:MFS family permease
VPFVDELASGVAPAAAPDVALDLTLPAGLTAGGIVTAFYGLVLIEAPLLAWSERVSVRWFSAASLAVLAIATLGCAMATGPITLALCLALYGPAAGCADAASEGVLVESSPSSRERTMARVTLAAAIGDLAVPVLLGALSLAGIGWRAVFAIAAVVAMVLAIVHASARGLDRGMPRDDEDEVDATIREAMRAVVGSRSLLGWTFAGVLVGLLDEVLVAFAAVHLADATPVARAVALGAWIAGGVLGLWWLERRIDSLDPLRVLRVTASIATIALAAFACTHDPALGALLLAIVGATASTFHPLVKARAYAALPGRPALVNAAASTLVPLDALAPLLLGAIALRFGESVAMAALVLAPIGIGLAAMRER